MRITTFVLLLISIPVAAQESTSEPPPPPPPSMPQSVEDVPVQTPELQPEVRIIRKKSETVEEYRIGGQLYMVKITPKNGYPYYLIDENGDGELETRAGGLENPNIPQWVIFRW